METQTSKNKMGLGKKILIGVGILFVIGLFGSQLDKDKKVVSSSTTKSENFSSEPTATSAPTAIGIGQVLKTDYFEVIISKVYLTNKINTGNEFLDVSAEQGNQFLVMTTTFKNIDSESRMIIDGSVFINYNGKDYEFDHSETIMADGYGLFLDQINPLTSKTTKLVYKVPTEIKGPAYYIPGRADDSQMIYLGILQ